MNAAANLNINATSEISYIAHNSLEISSKNQRVKASSKKADVTLKASIKKFFVMNPLFVVPTESGKGYEIAGGGRRYRLTGELIAEGLFPKNVPMPCRVFPREMLSSLTIAENLHEAVHAADNFMSYKALADDGLSAKEIAEAFGHSVKDVEKLLRLSCVAPDLIALFREDKITLESVMALTITDDHEKQMACWMQHKNNFYPRAIRSFLARESYNKDEPIVKFVTMKAYKKAGGNVTHDLFENNVYLHDVELLRDLANEKLAKEVDGISEGWAWVEHDLEYMSSGGTYTLLDAERVGVPESLQAEYDAAEREYEELCDAEEWDDEAIDAASEKVDTLNNQLDEYLSFSEEQKAISGVIVTIGGNGTVEIHRGLVKKEDLPKLRELRAALADAAKKDNDTGSSNGETDDDEAGNESEGAGFNISSALGQDLSNYYKQSFQSAMIDDPALCLDIFIFELASRTLSDGYYGGGLLSVTVSKVAPQGVDIEKTAAFEKLQAAKAALNLSWLDDSDDEESSSEFENFLALSTEEKQRIMAYCLAVSSHASKKHKSPQQEYAESSLKFNLLDGWKPTASNFYGRLNKGDLLNLGAEKFGATWAVNTAKAKRGEIAETLEKSPEFADWHPM